MFPYKHYIPNPFSRTTSVEAVKKRSRTGDGDKLLELSKWAFYSALPTGYWPLPLAVSQKGRGLSFQTLNVTLQLCLQSLWLWFYFADIGTALQPFLKDSVAIMALTTWHGILMLSTYILRISSLVSRSSSAEFWSGTLELFAEIRETARVLLGSHRVPDSLFRTAQLAMRKAALFRAALGVCDILYVIFLHVHILRTSQLLRYYFVLVLAQAVILHTGYVVWLSLFIRIYRVGYEVLVASMEEVDGNAELSGSLERVLKLFLSLERSVEGFNKHFCLSLFIQVLLDQSIILSYGFFICVYSDLKTGFVVGVIILPLTLYFLDLFALCTLSGGLTLTALETTERMAKVYAGRVSRSLQMKLQILVTRVTNGPPCIHVGNFFTINRSLILSILGALITYLIVLFQFHISAEYEEEDN